MVINSERCIARIMGVRRSECAPRRMTSRWESRSRRRRRGPRAARGARARAPPPDTGSRGSPRGAHAAPPPPAESRTLETVVVAVAVGVGGSWAAGASMLQCSVVSIRVLILSSEIPPARAPVLWAPCFLRPPVSLHANICNYFTLNYECFEYLIGLTEYTYFVFLNQY